MRPEDFTNPAPRDHPEVTDAAEVQAATKDTKQALLDIVTAKSEGGSVYGSEKIQVLTFAERDRGTLTVSRDNDGQSNIIARINRVEWPGKLYGDQLITNYSVVDAPDGLQLKKRVLVPGSEKEPDDDSVTFEQTALSGLDRLYAEIQRSQASEATQKELGLDTVSEAEAQNLLLLLDEAQPDAG